jgi:YHS domain-containing protein
MKRHIIVLLGAVLGLGFGGMVVADGMSGMKMDSPPPATRPTSAGPTTKPFQVEDLKNTICPVSGDKVEDSKLIEVYDGKAYHLCCPDCHTAFENHPERFAAAVAADPAKYGIK